MTYKADPDLDPILANADKDDLDILIDHITDKGEGRLMLSSDAKGILLAAKSLSTFVPNEAKRIISEEIRAYGGNTIVNLFRGGNGVSYKEILVDVAGHLKTPFNANSDCATIETNILMKILESSLEKMSAQEIAALGKTLGMGGRLRGSGPATIAAIQAAIQATGFAAYKLTAIMAQSVAKVLLGRGIQVGTLGPVMQSISVLSGPIGWAITGIWTAFDLASPAFRVTVPCVVQLAYMRQKALYHQQLTNESTEAHDAGSDEGNDTQGSDSETPAFCTQCGTKLPEGARFCPHCGTAI